ncbi:MAG: NUDIX hydrolase [Pseudomonadota bacterium]
MMATEGHPAGEPVGAPKIARLSTTVMLLRDAPKLEVLMVARAYDIDFVSGALVFPGGKVDPADRDPAWAEHADGGFEPSDLAIRVAAARECFEEVGLLLAEDRATGAPAAPDLVAAQGPRRVEVERAPDRFRSVLSAADLRLSLDRLLPFARWIAPEFAPKRFDTHFFLAEAPPGQTPQFDGRETTEALWLEPAEALARAEDGRATVIFPTRMNLRRLSACGSVSAALKTFAALDPPTVQPELVKDAAGKPCLTVPLAAGYGEIMEPLERITREASPKKSGA